MNKKIKVDVKFPHVLFLDARKYISSLYFFHALGKRVFWELLENRIGFCHFLTMIRLLLKYFPPKNSTAYCCYYNPIAVLLPYVYSWKLVPVGKLHALNDSRICVVSLLLLFIPAFVIFTCIIGAPFKVQFLESETAGSPQQVRGTSWWGVKKDCCGW